MLSQRLEWTELREVQEQTYSAVARGSDVLVIAPTAGGKSEAALIPVMDDILKNGRMGVTCLYISPLKALINDQEDRFRDFCIPTSLSVMKWHGDVPKGDRSWKDGEPPNFLMITPESLEVSPPGKNVIIGYPAGSGPSSSTNSMHLLNPSGAFILRSCSTVWII